MTPLRDCSCCRSRWAFITGCAIYGFFGLISSATLCRRLYSAFGNFQKLKGLGKVYTVMGPYLFLLTSGLGVNYGCLTNLCLRSESSSPTLQYPCPVSTHSILPATLPSYSRLAILYTGSDEATVFSQNDSTTTRSVK